MDGRVSALLRPGMYGKMGPKSRSEGRIAAPANKPRGGDTECPSSSVSEVVGATETHSDLVTGLVCPDASMVAALPGRAQEGIRHGVRT